MAAADEGYDDHDGADGDDWAEEEWDDSQAADNYDEGAGGSTLTPNPGRMYSMHASVHTDDALLEVLDFNPFAYLLMLWTRAMFPIAILLWSWTTTTAKALSQLAALANPIRRSTQPKFISTNLVNGSRLLTLTSPPKSFFNSLMMESLARLLDAGKQRKSGLSPADHAYANNLQTDLRKEAPDEMLAIADSGANRHFIPDSRRKQFLFRSEEVEENIGGMCSASQAKTTHFGIFAASANDDKGQPVLFTSVGFAVKNGRKPLFSEVQCCFAGNTVIHKGHPKYGKHGIYLKDSRRFIPYEWSDKEQAWFIRLKAPDKQHCMHARALDPRDILRD